MLIDTHKAIKDLTQAGVSQGEAEAIVGIVTRADEQVATRGDIKSLKEDIKDLEKATDRKLTALEERLTRRIYSAVFIGVAALGALNFFT